MKEAYQADPDMLARYLVEARAIPQATAGQLARDVIANKLSPEGMKALDMRPELFSLGPPDPSVTQLERFLRNFGGRPYNEADRRKAVELARGRWQAKGYQGLSYQDTAPMEVGGKGVKDKTAYIVFDPKHLTQLYTGAADAFDPQEPRDQTGEWTAGGSNSGGSLISTRKVTAKREGDKTSYRRVDMAALHQFPEQEAQVAHLFKSPVNYPGLKANESGSLRKVVNRMKENLRAIYDKASPENRKLWRGWYEGAHRIAERAAKKYHIPVAAAAVYATLSPQAQWDRNVYLGDHVIDIVKTKATQKWDDKMTEVASGWLPWTRTRSQSIPRVAAAASHDRCRSGLRVGRADPWRPSCRDLRHSRPRSMDRGRPRGEAEPPSRRRSPLHRLRPSSTEHDVSCPETLRLMFSPRTIQGAKRHL
jgi:hypothetical protein